MRKLQYKVRNSNGQEFITSDYEVAASADNRILETFLETVDTRTDTEKEWNYNHMLKIREHLKAKRG